MAGTLVHWRSDGKVVTGGSVETVADVMDEEKEPCVPKALGPTCVGVELGREGAVKA